jgi:hypothetical protein
MAARRRAVRSGPVPEPYVPPTLPITPPETPHPEVTRKTSSGVERREVLLPGVDDGPRAIAYGEQRLAGKLQFVHYVSSSDTLWCVIELCAGECDGLIEVRYSDGRLAPLTGGFWNYWWHAGTAAGQVNTNLKAVLPSWNEALPGTCYVVAELRQFGTYWNATIPEFVWRMRTRKCLMPDTGTYVYSTNVWDQWHDFARWSEGKGLSATRLDSASFVTARNSDTTAGRKASSHLLLMEQTSADDVIQTFRLMARAYWFWDATKFRVVADRPGASVATYDDRHVAKSTVLDLDRSDIFDRANKVTIWYTDVTNNWQLVPMSLATAAVDAGTEEAIEEEYRLPHLHDPAQVKTLLTYLLNSRQFDSKVRERWLAVTSDRQLGDIVTRNIEARGLTIPMRLVRRTKNPDNSFEVELFETNDAKFAEYVITDAPKIQSTYPDPSAAPPNIDAGSISWTEEQYVTASGEWLPKGTLTFTPPASFPFLQTVEVWVSINGGPQRHWFDSISSPAMTPALYETGTYALTLKTRHRITQQVSTGTTVSVAVQGVTGAVPEVIDAGGDADHRFWNAPQTRSIARYGAASWTHSGLTTFSAAAINDGIITTTCAVSPSGAAWLRFDAGVGQTKSFRELTYYHTGTLPSTPWVEYSNDGATWTAVTAQLAARTPTDAGSGVTCRTLAWTSDAGARRFWRINLSGVATFTEFHFAEYLGEYAQVREFRVYDMRDEATPKLFTTVPKAALPTSATPLSVEAIMTRVVTTWNVDGADSSDVLITVVNAAGTESAGVRSLLAVAYSAAGGQSPFIPQSLTGLTLANGLNLAVALPVGPGLARVTGPTAAFTVGGIIAEAGGVMAMFANATAFTMTLYHEHASATAANRLSLPNARNVDIPAGSIIILGYDSSSLRWRIASPIGQFGAAPTADSTLAIARSASGNWAGFNAPTLNRSFLWGTGGSGVLQEGVAWKWMFNDAGALVIGTVPWASVTSKPTTLAGYGISDAAPIASPTFTGNPTAPTPATSDNDTSLATTAFVRSAIDTYGGGVKAVTAVSPANYGAGSTSGFYSTSSGTTPRGPSLTGTTITNTTTNILNIAGKGYLRFLSLGRSAGGPVTLTVTIDGVNVIDNAQYTVSGVLGTHFNVSIVGGIGMSIDGTNTYLIGRLDETGLRFETSLSITVGVTTNTAYVAHAYKLG